ncbi:Cyanophycin synthetase (plasmid) [Phaeobacter piscinae]|uniref:Cyanophycin synthetase n=1 Tax=Phaeobacter piscinae TaxID=1580596 RepID=A0ABN5DKN4_9RHOB|nr:Cyanophycin synthetase [Phaeobacter piscinae]AUQ88466.1 Cyanophycin synthetase [Phaeobacter piscinae]AUR26349.1 Cyanophycin synthetase [Phaeobacter piscinae]
MNIILFLPPKILLQHGVTDWVDAIGPQSVILTCASAKEALTRSVQDGLDIRFFQNFNDSPEVELAAIDIARSLPDPLCVALAEIDVLRAARVNDYLGVSENAAAQLELFRDKHAMKIRARDAGLPVSEMAVVRSALDIRHFVDRLGYPVVLKPRDGRGSNGVCVIRDDAALADWLATQSSSTFYNTMIECFVAGDHYIVNGLYVAGQPILVSPVRVMTSALDFLGGRSHDLHMLEATTPLRDRLVAYSRRLIEEVMPSPPTLLFHLEVFVSPEGRIILGEIASRLGGVFFNQEMTEAWGIDPRMTYLKAMRDPGFQRTLRPQMMAEPERLVGQLCVPPREGVLQTVPENCPFDFVRAYRMSGVVGRHYGQMAFTNAEILNAIVEGRDEAELRARLRQLEDWFHSACQWQTAAAA